MLKYLWILIVWHEVYCDVHEDNWIEPNAWGREHHSIKDLDSLSNLDYCRKCPLERPSSDKDDNDLTLVVYKKFVATLFNKQKLQYDSERHMYSRSVEFFLSLEQLENLEKFKDPRDLDSTLMEICSSLKSKTIDNNMSILALFGDIFKDLKQLLKTNEIQFCLIILIVIMSGWFIHRRYHIGLLTIVIGGGIIFGYIVTYFDCNKKLEIEKMLEVLESSDAYQRENSGFWITTQVKNFFGYTESYYQKERITQKLRKSSGISLPFCRPDHVLMIYVNELCLKQLQLFLEECTKTFQMLGVRLTFPYNIAAACLLVVLIGYIVKYTFKYILNPKSWIEILRHPSNRHPEILHGPQLSQKDIASITEDRLSGDNLKLLLNAFASAKPLPVSGVQELPTSLSIKPNSMDDSDSSQKNSSSDDSFDVIKIHDKSEDKENVNINEANKSDFNKPVST